MRRPILPLLIAACLLSPAIGLAKQTGSPVDFEQGIVSPFAIDAQPMGTTPLSMQAADAGEASLAGIENTLDKALGLIGIPYRWGGASPERGFDCSGFVQHVYQQTRDLVLPHSARAQAREGEKLDKKNLAPGDLVFFNTMRRAFSHVGIYLGDGLFVHAPRKGEQVRVDSIQSAYWRKRFNGARRVAKD